MFPVQRYIWYIIRDTVYLDKGKNMKMHLGTRRIVSLMFGLHSVFGKTCMHLVRDFKLCGSTSHG